MLATWTLQSCKNGEELNVAMTYEYDFDSFELY